MYVLIWAPRSVHLDRSGSTVGPKCLPRLVPGTDIGKDQTGSGPKWGEKGEAVGGKDFWGFMVSAVARAYMGVWLSSGGGGGIPPSPCKSRPGAMLD
jgi:hypothetical protein